MRPNQVFFRSMDNDNSKSPLDDLVFIINTTQPQVFDGVSYDNTEYYFAVGSPIYMVDIDIIHNGDLVKTYKNYNYNNNNNSNVLIFPFPGIFEVRIRESKTGSFGSISNRNCNLNRKLINLKQWGTNKWESMSYMFSNCQSMNVSATDSPYISEVDSLEYMFAGSTFNEDISNWDVSNVNNMKGLFYNSIFNQDIGNWDVSNVINMESLFQFNHSFNQDIGNWDVSNVINMNSTFNTCLSFNQDLSGWCVSNVNDYTDFDGGVYNWQSNYKPNFQSPPC